MCDVPSIAVFCSESIECFPGTVSKFFFKLLVTIPVAPIITGIIVHYYYYSIEYSSAEINSVILNDSTTLVTETLPFNDYILCSWYITAVCFALSSK